MNLNSEILKIKDSFSEGGILTKIFLVLGFFLTLSSLTSLSGKIVAWKGFILSGINFYQKYFVIPISSVASSVGLNYTESEVHTATVASMCVITGMKLLATGQKDIYQNINKKYNSELKPSMAMFWIVGIITPIGIWAWYGVSDPAMRVWLLITVTLLYPVFIIVPKILISKKSDDSLEENYFDYVKGYYAYMLSFIIVIGALAAINTGLQEKEPNNSNNRVDVPGAPS